MNYLKRCSILGSFILLTASHWLGALNDVPMYDDAKTEELKQYMNSLSITTILNDAELPHRIKKLIEEGANPNVASNVHNGSSAIHFSAQAGDIGLIQFLLDHGEVIEAKDNNGKTTLHRAALYGHKEAINMLVSLGANIEAEDNGGWTPLHHAASRGHKDAIDILLTSGANIDAKTSAGNTPLYIAAFYGQLKVLIHLLSFGATGDKNALDKVRATTKEVLARYFSEEKILPSEALLYAAIRLKKEDLGRIDASADEINRPDAYKNTSLDIALISRNVHVIPRLLALGADPWCGLFDGVFLASRIPEFNESKESEPSIYEQILYVPLRRYWLIKQALGEALYNDVLDQIVKLEIDCRRTIKSLNPMTTLKKNET